MDENEIQVWRMQRLEAMVEREGGKAATGRKLGYRDGAFVGQMLRGDRPISEKTVLAVHALSGYAGWFDPPQDMPAGALPYNTTKVREVPVVGKGSGGVMPERIWTDGDYPAGKTGECADIATNDPHAFLVGVDGPSMIPRYNPGEFALVEPSTEPEIEDDVLVRLETGETMLKRLLSRRGGWRFGSYNDPATPFFVHEQVTWVYYVAHPVPRRKIKSRC